MKDGFILYCSHYPTINKLSIVEKGKLLDAVFQYHIDNKEPKFDSISVEITFSFLKQQFDRDLEKYQNVVNRNKKNIEKRWDKTDTKNTNGIIGTIINTKNTDNEMGKDNDKVKGKNLNINAAIAATQKRINDFKVSLFPFVKDYKKELVKEFFDYWSELNSSQTKMRWELQKTFEIKKRLTTWSKNENKFYKNGKNINSNIATSDSDLIDAIKQGVGRAEFQRNKYI